jgi:2,5-diketo-D-gluconate reductase A
MVHEAHVPPARTEHRRHGLGVDPLDQGDSLSHPVIVQAARQHERTPAQVVLRWHLRHGFIPIPRSVNRDHIVENFQVWDFKLTEDEMNAIDSLDRGAILQTT